MLDGARTRRLAAAGGRRPVSAGLRPDDARRRRRAGRRTASATCASRASRSISTGPTRSRSRTSCCSAATATRCSRASRSWSVPKSGTLIAVALEKYIAARGEVAPAVEGRIVIGSLIANARSRRAEIGRTTRLWRGATRRALSARAVRGPSHQYDAGTPSSSADDDRVDAADG